MFILHSVYQVSSISQYTTPKHEWYTSKHWFSGPLRKFMYFGFMKNVGQNCQKVASNGAVPSSRERRSSRLHLPPSLSTQCLSHGALPYSDVLIRLRITNPSSLPSLIFFFTCLPCHSKTLETHRHCLRSLLLLTLATGGDVNSSYTLGHSMSCFLVMVWSRKFAGTKVRGVRRIRSQGDGNGAITGELPLRQPLSFRIIYYTAIPHLKESLLHPASIRHTRCRLEPHIELHFWTPPCYLGNPASTNHFDAPMLCWKLYISEPF